jgi:hypothetical protein
MRNRRRKTLVVCDACHDHIHTGQPNAHNVITGEPDDSKVTSGSEGGHAEKDQPTADTSLRGRPYSRSLLDEGSFNGIVAGFAAVDCCRSSPTVVAYAGAAKATRGFGQWRRARGTLPPGDPHSVGSASAARRYLPPVRCPRRRQLARGRSSSRS